MDVVKIYHKNLLKFKNKHVNDTAYIFGSGPTVNKFKAVETGVYIGCNQIYKHDTINKDLKYYFFGHGYKKYKDHSLFGNIKEGVDGFLQNKNVIGFCNVSFHGKLIETFTKDDIEKFTNNGIYVLDMLKRWHQLQPDIHNNPICNHNITFTAIHFALYCGFKKIYLVGCDCTQSNCDNYFYKDDGRNHDHVKYLGNRTRNMINCWMMMKAFKNKHFPECKIININPVCLKNRMDGDIYT